MKRQSILKRIGASIVVGSAVVLTAASAEAANTSRAWLGVIGKDGNLPADKIHHHAADVRVAKVIRGSPAYYVGLRPGDVVWKFDDMRMHSTAQLAREIRDEKPGKTVPIEIFHLGKREDLKVALGSHHFSTPQPNAAHVTGQG